jgi:hypothetical protein
MATSAPSRAKWMAWREGWSGGRGRKGRGPGEGGSSGGGATMAASAPSRAKWMACGEEGGAQREGEFVRAAGGPRGRAGPPPGAGARWPRRRPRAQSGSPWGGGMGSAGGQRRESVRVGGVGGTWTGPALSRCRVRGGERGGARPASPVAGSALRWRRGVRQGFGPPAEFLRLHNLACGPGPGHPWARAVGQRRAAVAAPAAASSKDGHGG